MQLAASRRRGKPSSRQPVTIVAGSISEKDKSRRCRTARITAAHPRHSASLLRQQQTGQKRSHSRGFRQRHQATCRRAAALLNFPVSLPPG
jgi:hypothetical protein